MAWRQHRSLQWALGLSLAVHGGLLGFRFMDPAGFERVFRDTPLDVILVNAHTTEMPVKAQAIAQASLAGGGELAVGNRATSPLPATALEETGNASDESRRRVDQLQDQQQQLLAQIRREMAMLPPPDPTHDKGTPDERDQEERRRQMLKLLAEIETRINDESAKPKKRYVSPATREAVYALYYDRLKHRIEERGTTDFPQHLGQKLYGELTMNITVDAKGKLLDAEVVTGSGNKILDHRAVAIVRAAAPFGEFSSAMHSQTDQVVVTSQFRFTRDEGMAATIKNSHH